MSLARRACNWKQGEWVVLFIFNFTLSHSDNRKIVRQKYNLVAAVWARLGNTQQATNRPVVKTTETDDGKTESGVQVRLKFATLVVVDYN